VYIDESGDEGFLFSRGSSDWFVLSAVITQKSWDVEEVKLVDNVRELLGKPAGIPLHFRNLKHEQKFPYVSEIAKSKLRTISVLVHKPSINEKEMYQERYRLYFYSVRLLLERVSWLCRDSRKSKIIGDGSADIIFSNRSGMSYSELKAYLDKLKAMSEFSDIRIDWSVVKSEQITALPHRARMGLQIADAVASSYFRAVQALHGFRETRYASILKPVAYFKRKVYLGYGIKFWPKGPESVILAEGDSGWMVDDSE